MSKHHVPVPVFFVLAGGRTDGSIKNVFLGMLEGLSNRVLWGAVTLSTSRWFETRHLPPFAGYKRRSSVLGLLGVFVVCPLVLRVGFLCCSANCFVFCVAPTRSHELLNAINDAGPDLQGEISLGDQHLLSVRFQSFRLNHSTAQKRGVCRLLSPLSCLYSMSTRALDSLDPRIHSVILRDPSTPA